MREWFFDPARSSGQGRPANGLGTERNVVRPALAPGDLERCFLITRGCSIDRNNTGATGTFGSSATVADVLDVDTGSAFDTDDNKKLILLFPGPIDFTLMYITLRGRFSFSVSETTGGAVTNTNVGLTATIRAKPITALAGLDETTLTFANYTTMTIGSASSINSVLIGTYEHANEIYHSPALASTTEGASPSSVDKPFSLIASFATEQVGVLGLLFELSLVHNGSIWPGTILWDGHVDLKWAAAHPYAVYDLE